MKRSGNITLMAMGVASFAASFVAGNAVLNWMSPPAAKNCTTQANGQQVCGTSRSFFSHHFTWSSSGISDDRSAPKAQLASTGATAKSFAPATTTRGGFGASAASMHASAGA